MKITSPTNAILAFAPIGFIEEHKHKLHSSSRYKQSATDESVLKRGITFEPKNDKTNLNKSVNKSANLCFGGFFNVNKLCKSDKFKKGLEFASDNGALFAATVAFITGALLRPVAIFATPGIKKENKEVASAQSISSSLIGLGLMALVSTPIAHGIKKINANPAKYLSKKTIERLRLGEEKLEKSKKYNFTTQLFKLGCDFICAIPKALLTCALIPPIISKLFPKKEKSIEYYPTSMVCFKAGFNYPKSKQLFKGFIKESQNNENITNK